MYNTRIIDQYLSEWASSDLHKPILLRGARQVGKSTAVRHLGEQFEHYVEINFEQHPECMPVFQPNLDVRRIISQLAALCQKVIVPGKTLLFLDEIQYCPEAVMSLRFFKEDLPELHVIAAGSLLEFALSELPTFGVGRIHSMFMHPMTFDEFLMAHGDQLLIEARNQCDAQHPLAEPLHEKLIARMRDYILVGGMPEVVARWVQTHDYLKCQELQDDILMTYEDDFPKYRKKVNPLLLRAVLRSVATQAGGKFVYSRVGENLRTAEVKNALDLLILAGLVIPVSHTSANGLPLGAEADTQYRKMILLDTGLMLRLLNMMLGDVSDYTQTILTGSTVELINKGPMAEQLVGLEMLRYDSPNLRHELYYWVRQAKNSLAEVDYVTAIRQAVVPVEVKAGVKGGMKSLWLFMREKHLSQAVRCSFENFGAFNFTDSEDNDAMRHVTICPIYAIARMRDL
jgi:hypothetical protein